MRDIEKTARAYLSAYADKDLNQIGLMIADHVKLQDWNVLGFGRDFFLSQTRTNFESADSIEITILNLLVDENQVAAQLAILLDGDLELQVLDLIGFDELGKINSVRAFKG